MKTLMDYIAIASMLIFMFVTFCFFIGDHVNPYSYLCLFISMVASYYYLKLDLKREVNANITL